MNLIPRSNKIISEIKKNKINVLIFSFIIFLCYCSLSLGQSWDEAFHLNQGKIVLNYFFSLGKINGGENIAQTQYYSPIYWTLQYFITLMFPPQFKLEVAHLVNLLFSISTVIAFKQLGKELFNKKVGIIFCTLLIFYPVFFGHMSINSKDTILAFCHVWFFYLVIKYLKKQDINFQSKKYLLLLSLLLATGTGIQLMFIGSLIPIIIFCIFDILWFKKLINKNFSIKKFLIDFIIIFLLTYTFLIIFWIDAHQNIFLLPAKFFIEFITKEEIISNNIWKGWPYNLVNGKFFLSSEIPKYYVLVSFLYKSPEFIITSYFIFLLFFIKINKFLKQKFNNLSLKISLILILVIFPTLILYIVPYPSYDGLRLSLWFIPYTLVIPGLTIYFLIENFRSFKITSCLLIVLFFFFIFNFFAYTPYQYSYLNYFTGQNINKNKKFENDYWGLSIKELVKKINLDKNKNYNISTCGVSPNIAKKYFQISGFKNVNFVTTDKAEYIIMTNRAILDENSNEKKITNCFNLVEGDDILVVKRMGVILSVFRKI